MPAMLGVRSPAGRHAGIRHAISVPRPRTASGPSAGCFRTLGADHRPSPPRAGDVDRPCARDDVVVIAGLMAPLIVAILTGSTTAGGAIGGVFAMLAVLMLPIALLIVLMSLGRGGPLSFMGRTAGNTVNLGMALGSHAPSTGRRARTHPDSRARATPVARRGRATPRCPDRVHRDCARPAHRRLPPRLVHPGARARQPRTARTRRCSSPSPPSRLAACSRCSRSSRASQEQPDDHRHRIQREPGS